MSKLISLQKNINPISSKNTNKKTSKLTNNSNQNSLNLKSKPKNENQVINNENIELKLVSQTSISSINSNVENKSKQNTIIHSKTNPDQTYNSKELPEHKPKSIYSNIVDSTYINKKRFQNKKNKSNHDNQAKHESSMY